MSESAAMSMEAQEAMRIYLAQVEKFLKDAGISAEERRGILDDVEAQIHDMLRERHASSPSRSDMEAILAELPLPESYAKETVQAVKTESAPTPRVCPVAVVGAVWGVIGLMALFLLRAIYYALAYRAGMEPPKPALWPLIGFALLPLSLLVLFGTTLLGSWSIARIRMSKGKLYGLFLAVIDVLVPPLLLMFGFLFGKTGIPMLMLLVMCAIWLYAISVVYRLLKKKAHT